MVQSLQQLRQKYKEDADTIKGNCDNWVFLTTREFDLLKEISDLCGETFYRDSGNIVRSKPLISTSELQRFKKEYGETLILHGRNYPFVTELPDIDEYKFQKYPPIKTKNRQLPKIILYDAEKVLEAIRKRKRHIPFSVEVYGEKKYYKKFPMDAIKKDIFDW
jgi:type IV secretion system protein VirD4